MLSLAAEGGTLFEAWQADNRPAADGFAAIKQVLVKVPGDEANLYKGMLVWIAVTVARASGPWLSDKISNQERIAIKVLADSLEYSAQDAIMATFIPDVLRYLPR